MHARKQEILICDRKYICDEQTELSIKSPKGGGGGAEYWNCVITLAKTGSDTGIYICT